MRTTVEIIERNKYGKIFYYVYVNEKVDDVFELLESAEQRYHFIVETIKNPIPDKVIKSIEI